MQSLSPPERTLKTKISNGIIKVMVAKWRIYSKEAKYKECEAQMRTVQESLVDDWPARIAELEYSEPALRVYNEAAAQNNKFVRLLKTCKSPDFENVDKVLVDIFTWRVELSKQTAAVRMLGLSYDLAVTVTSTKPLVETGPMRRPNPPPVAPVVQHHSHHGAQALSSQSRISIDSTSYRELDPNEFHTPTQLSPPPPRKPATATSSSMADAASIVGGMPATGVFPGAGAPAETASVRSIGTSAFGHGSQQSHSSSSGSGSVYSSGSGASFRASMDSGVSTSASHYASARQSIDSNISGGSGYSQRTSAPSGGSYLRSGLAGDPATVHLAQSMSSLTVSSPYHPVAPSPTQGLGHPQVLSNPVPPPPHPTLYPTQPLQPGIPRASVPPQSLPLNQVPGGQSTPSVALTPAMQSPFAGAQFRSSHAAADPSTAGSSQQPYTPNFGSYVNNLTPKAKRPE